RVKMRDPKNRDHKMKVTELATLAPNFQFARFFAARGGPAFTEVNVVPPDFFQKVNPVIESVSLDDWKTYFRWTALRGAAGEIYPAVRGRVIKLPGKVSGGDERTAGTLEALRANDRRLARRGARPALRE